MAVKRNILKSTTMFNIGDKVRFTPKNQAMKDFAGIRKVKRMAHSGFVQLECGDIVLLARVDELTKL